MAMRQVSVMLLIVLGTPGCASLVVEVDVLDPTVVEPRAESDFILRAMEQILAEDETVTKQLFADVQDAHYQAYVDLSEEYRRDADETTDEQEKELLKETASELIEGFNDLIAPIYDTRQADWLATTKMIKDLYAQYEASGNPDQRRSLRKRLIVRIRERDHLRQQLDQFVAHDLNRQTALDTEAKQRALTEARIRSKQLFDSGGFLQSRYAYYVVKAETDNWAELFDRSFGRGTFGNTDVAIKALGPGNFTIKGLSFNPSDVAIAASKVTTQSVLLAAQIAGVPIKLSGSPAGSNGAALAESSTRLSETLAKQQRLRLSVHDYHDALLQIAEAILREKAILEGDDPDARRAAINAITAVYDSNVSRLRVSDSKSGS